ncbi:MAG: glycoside hydrolase family 3 protein [Acidobacteria bacterium]|nr:glycoside hydrolase family 3 protein [Acidobacteriota bacterium]
MKRMVVGIWVLLLAVWSLAGAQRDEWVENTLRSMSLDEKIGQLLFPVTAGTFKNIEGEEFKKIRVDLTEHGVGGYHIGRGDPAAVALLTNDMQRVAKTPLLVTADLEAGAGLVYANATRLPSAMALGATGDEQLAYRAGKIVAEEGRALGVHINFHPVADVNNNPLNPIINTRSFGEDVQSVSKLTAAYVRGIQENGQIATAKHFPGHGDVATDSHLELPVLDVNRERLFSLELPPFRAAIASGVGAIMSAHIYLPQLEAESGVPATLSRNVLTTLLRQELGFTELIFTDAMDMRAITTHFGTGDATVRALEAGADVILYPPDPAASIIAVREAVSAGRLSQSRIDDSARRILRAKARLGLHRNRLVDVERVTRVVGSPENRRIAEEISEAAITLVRDDKNVVPQSPSDARLVVINILDRRDGWRDGPVGVTANAELAKRFPHIVTVQVDEFTSTAEIDVIRKMTGLADILFVNGFARVAAYKGTTGFNEAQIGLLRHLASVEKPLVFTMFGNPYLLTHVPELPSYIVAYDTHPAAERAAVRAITGEIEFRGRLPVSLPGLYAVGHRLERQR